MIKMNLSLVPCFSNPLNGIIDVSMIHLTLGPPDRGLTENRCSEMGEGEVYTLKWYLIVQFVFLSVSLSVFGSEGVPLHRPVKRRNGELKE